LIHVITETLQTPTLQAPQILVSAETRYKLFNYKLAIKTWDKLPNGAPAHTFLSGAYLQVADVAFVWPTGDSSMFVVL
jgi:hypothetical protein